MRIVLRQSLSLADRFAIDLDQQSESERHRTEPDRELEAIDEESIPLSRMSSLVIVDDLLVHLSVVRSRPNEYAFHLSAIVPLFPNESVSESLLARTHRLEW